MAAARWHPGAARTARPPAGRPLPTVPLGERRLRDFHEGPKLIDLAYRHIVVELERQPCVAEA